MTLNGKVKWFNLTKGYGFITPNDDTKDVFVHSSAVREASLSGLAEGESITFEVKEGAKGPFAVNLQKG
jgi:CspA family cold shock protein